MRRLQECGLVRIFTVAPSKNAAPTAGVALLHDGEQAFYWIAGSVPGPSMTVLIGRLLLELKAAGVDCFDFAGANTPSIAEFKRRFGATLTPYFAVTRRPNRLLGAVTRFKSLFS